MFIMLKSFKNMKPDTILNLQTCHKDVFGRIECLLIGCSAQCKFSLTVAVTVSSLFLHVLNTKPSSQRVYFVNFIFVDVVFQFFCGAIW